MPGKVIFIDVDGPLAWGSWNEGKVKIMEGTRSFSHKDDNRIQTHHTFTCIHNGCLPAFLISLGLSYGKKTETPRNPISGWIMKTKEYGRQFLKGFQGGHLHPHENHSL